MANCLQGFALCHRRAFRIKLSLARTDLDASHVRRNPRPRGRETEFFRAEHRRISRWTSVDPEDLLSRLGSHPGYELNRRQAKGAGAVISFLTDDVELSTNIVEATRLFKIAVSFGSVGWLISLPCRMSHASIAPSLKNRFAPPEHLVRLSVGIEDVDDLIDDLDQAFSGAMESRSQVGLVAGAR